MSMASTESSGENWRKKDLFYIIRSSLVKFYPTVMWKEEILHDEFEYVAEKFSLPNVEHGLLYSCALQQNLRRKI